MGGASQNMLYIVFRVFGFGFRIWALGGFRGWDFRFLGSPYTKSWFGASQSRELGGALILCQSSGNIFAVGVGLRV